MSRKQDMAVRALKLLWEEFRNAKTYRDGPGVQDDAELRRRIGDKIETPEWLIDRMTEEI